MFNTNLATLLWRTGTTHTTHNAIEFRDGVVTYSALRQRAAGVAAMLGERGIRTGDRVAILLDRDATAAAAFYGVMAHGAIAVVINETLRPRQIEHILAHSDATALLTSADLLGRQPRPLVTAAQILGIGDSEPVASCDPVTRVESDIAQIIYTSGSTGMPKGVTITHGNLHAGVRAVTGYLGISHADRIASLLPFSFDYGANQLHCAVAAGATLVIERSPVPQQIAKTLRQRGITVLAAVPPLWLQLLRAPEFTRMPIPSLRAMTNTGGRLPVEAVRRLRTVHPEARLFLMYGLTEAFRATYLDPEEVDRRPDSIGKAIPGCEIMVIRDDLTECEPGETGELVQRGSTVGLGYWKDIDATERVYRPNPLRPTGAPAGERVVFSGDLVRRDSQGFLYFMGRRDRMIKTMGYRVSPDEVTDVLYASGQIVEGVVDAEPDEARGDRIIARVVLAADGSLARLKAYCRSELPSYLQPARFELREMIPRTSSGKHDIAGSRQIETMS